MKKPPEGGFIKWQWNRDSNSRNTLVSAGFQDQCLKPLGHSTMIKSIITGLAL